jgi:hypothetical protein
MSEKYGRLGTEMKYLIHIIAVLLKFDTCSINLDADQYDNFFTFYVFSLFLVKLLFCLVFFFP